MQLGAVLSQNEIGTDPRRIARLRPGGAGLGYDFLVVADHVVGADKADHPELDRTFPLENTMHEPFALCAYLAGVAPGLGLLPSVVILPQRQTVLVAKQAASVDFLSGGRFRLGVGIGWHEVEFAALGVPFRDRARRFEEQTRAAAPPVDRARGHLRGAVPRCARGRPDPLAGAAADPALDRGEQRGGDQARDELGRWVPAATPARLAAGT